MTGTSPEYSESEAYCPNLPNQPISSIGRHNNKDLWVGIRKREICL